jgi:hypothetical protein
MKTGLKRSSMDDYCVQVSNGSVGVGVARPAAPKLSVVHSHDDERGMRGTAKSISITICLSTINTQKYHTDCRQTPRQGHAPCTQPLGSPPGERAVMMRMPLAPPRQVVVSCP